MSRQTTTRRRHGVRRMSERKRLTITAISAVLALVTVVICALTGVFNFHKGNERILPNLVGQTEESAKAQLAELDAEPSITYENSDETKGIVIRQDVNEGTQLKHRQTVAFVVSLGPKEQPTAPEDTPVAIPSFVGLTLEQAQATAKSLGVTIEFQFSNCTLQSASKHKQYQHVISKMLRSKMKEHTCKDPIVFSLHNGGSICRSALKHMHGIL